MHHTQQCHIFQAIYAVLPGRSSLEDVRENLLKNYLSLLYSPSLIAKRNRCRQETPYSSSIRAKRFTRHFALYPPSHPYIYSDVNALLTVSLKPASPLCIAFSNPEDVNTERNTDDTGNNQWPRIAPDFG